MNENHIKLYLMLLALCCSVINTVNSMGCPQKCICQQRTVRCLRQQIQTIPEVPADTNILDLRYNHIKEIPSNAFNGLKQLHSIFLNENQITTIADGAFSGLPSMRFLYLNQNHIKSIAATAFANMTKLERLHLYGNKIQRIPFGMFDNMDSLKTLRLDSNLLECDCSVMWLVKQLHNMRDNLTASVNCKSPEVMDGKNLADLTDEDFHCKKPEIIQDPNDLEVVFGSTATFTCKAEGNPEPEIIWMLNANEINQTDSRVLILPDGSLRIDKAIVGDQGTYTCMAKNTFGETLSKEAKMSLRSSDEPSRPQFVQIPAGHVVVDDDSEFFVMHCTASGTPEPQITWSFNGHPLEEDSDRVHFLENGTLVIHNPNEEDEGTYICEATNYLGSISTVANYKINVPRITVAPEYKKVKPGTNVVLACDAEGNPEPAFFWTKDDHTLKFGNRISLTVDNKTLSIDHIKESDAGLYACIAENILGSDEASAEIEILNSHAPPVIIFEPYDLEAIPGTTIEMPCGTGEETDAPPVSKWKKDGRTLTTTLKYTFSSAGSLYIANVNEPDAGRYECTITNEFGRATASALITVKKRDDLAPGDRFIKVAFSEASTEIDSAINQTISSLFSTNSSAPKHHGDLFRIVRFPTGPARELARASEIYERTLVNIRKHINSGMNLTTNSSDFSYDDLLSPDYLELLAKLSDCTAHRITPNCTDMCYHGKYRTIDGSCNNFQNPLWGSSLSGFRRILPPIYENGFNSPVGFSKERLYNGFKKPSARLVSTNLITTEEITSDTQITHMVMQWGQFLDHDLDHALPAVSSESWDGVDCKKTCDPSPPCYPIEIPENDPRVKNRRCIDFVRSSSTCGSGVTSIFFGKIHPREQINQLTSFIDASQVYGYSEQFSRDLRNISMEGADFGLLREGVNFPNQKSMLPFTAPTDGVDCRRNLEESSINCFTAGDVRVNEQVGLLAMHTIWMREHNRIATFFNDINPHWSGEQTYQEARKIVGAMMQHITYKHWLPLIIGAEGMEIMGNYESYEPSVNPSISNEFATAALRFGHSLINPVLHRLDWNFEPIEQGHLPLHKAFFAPWRVVYEGGVDPLLRGLFTVPAKLKMPEQSLNSELTEKLFQNFHAVALDLAAINIQRSRDHAIPTYQEYRKVCNLSVSESFENMTDISNQHIRDKLKELYGHPDNIDIWVGGILEDQIKGARVGPLFRCLLIEQFKRLRDGDRFWYENPAVFKPEQLAQIKQTNLGRVLCDNGDNITRSTDNAFLLPTQQGGYKECIELPMVLLRVWTDCSDCGSRSAYNLDITKLPQQRSNRVRRDLKNVLNNKDSHHQNTNNNNKNNNNNNNDNDFNLNSIQHSSHDEEFNIDNDYFDMNEERIEGLEFLIEGFQKTLKRMRREIRKLEQHNLELTTDNSCSPNNNTNNHHHNDNKNKSTKPHYHCSDKKGINRLNNEIWMDDPCTSCICQHHQITCSTEKCSELPVKCEDGFVLEKKENQCCSSCVDTKQLLSETLITTNITNSR